MTIEAWLSDNTNLLSKAGVDTARLDALVLLCDEVGRDKAWVLAHHGHVLQGSELEKLSTKIAQRTQHVPLAYLRGKAEFYGREFLVNEHILVPRPESEAMIELLKRGTLARRSLSEGGRHESRSLAKALAKAGGTIVDIGTGSGCLAITAKLILPQAEVWAVDIDRQCIKLASFNAKKLQADVHFLQGSLLQPFRDSRLRQGFGGHARLETQDSIILANLPYVPDDYPVNKAATHEPALALFGGPDGLDLYRTLFAQANELSCPPKLIITEALTEQHALLSDIAQKHGYALRETESLAQLFAQTSYDPITD